MPTETNPEEMTMTNTNTPTVPAALVISYPTKGGFTTASNFTGGCTPYVSAENLGRTWRDVFIGEDLVGSAERQDGSWWVDVAGCPTLEVANLRSMRRAVAAVVAHVTEHNPDLLAPPVVVAVPTEVISVPGKNHTVVTAPVAPVAPLGGFVYVGQPDGEEEDDAATCPECSGTTDHPCVPMCTLRMHADRPAPTTADTPDDLDTDDAYALVPFIAAADRAHRLAAVVFIATRMHAPGAHDADLLALIADLPGLDDDGLGDLVTDLIDPVAGDAAWAPAFRMTAAILAGTRTA